MIGLRLLALAAGLRNHAEIGQLGLCSAPKATHSDYRFVVRFGLDGCLDEQRDRFRRTISSRAT
jgi:hypothetical protein